VKPNTSALAVLAMLTSILALMTAMGASICILVEQGVRFNVWATEDLYIGTFIAAAVAVFLGVGGLLMGMTASALVREARGTLKGKGAAHAALFLSLIAVAMPLGHVKPRLAEIDRQMGEARTVAVRMVEELQAGRFAEARSFFADPLRNRVSEAELKSRVERRIQGNAVNGKAPVPWRTRMAGSTARVDYGSSVVCSAVVLEHDGRWKVTGIESLLDRLGD
jgi:hypothetical protein